MINRPQFNPLIGPIDPIDKDRSEDQPDEQKKRRVLYQGRAWAEAEEEELPVQPTQPRPPYTSKSKASTRVCADRVLLERAAALLRQMTTLEERAAQLCFYETEAVYDVPMQHAIELLIQTWQFGGILFKKGEYKREVYLIERYQEISKTPLLIANDFLHGLSFYLQGDTLFPEELPEQRLSDLGKAVMVQNRRLGVHIQFDQERGEKRTIHLSEKQAEGFRRGIREARGIVGKERTDSKNESRALPANGSFPLLDSPELQIQEMIGYKTVAFFDGTREKEEELEMTLLQAFEDHFDLFLLKGNIGEAIRALCKLVRAGKISEEELDKRIMKILTIKAWLVLCQASSRC